MIDCTLGRGGHASLIADALGTGGTLIGIDADPRNLDFARGRLSGVPGRVRLFHANFAELDEVLDSAGVTQVDAIAADLGLSTNQFLDPSYGMSFSSDAPLDMRIDPRSAETAADLVNRLPERELANLIYRYSDERFSRRIARKIVEARRVSPIHTTRQLAELVRSAVPRPAAGGEAQDAACPIPRRPSTRRREPSWRFAWW